jgi:hypothetical protein
LETSSAEEVQGHYEEVHHHLETLHGLHFGRAQHTQAGDGEAQKK